MALHSTMENYNLPDSCSGPAGARWWLLWNEGEVTGRQENLQEIKEIITWHEEESNTETENLQEIKEISTCMVRMYWETYVKGRKRLFHHWMTCCKDILFPATTSFMQQKWSTYKSTQDFTQGVFFLNLKFKF